jgi:hypothetical protein
MSAAGILLPLAVNPHLHIIALDGVYTRYSSSNISSAVRYPMSV